MGRSQQRRLVFGTSIVGAFLALASVAYACVTFWGQLDVTSGGGTSTAIGSTLHPNAANQEFCTPPTLGAAAQPGSRDSITVRVGPTNECTQNRGVAVNALDDGRYSVRIQGGDVFRPHDSGTGYFRMVGENGGPAGGCWRTIGENNIVELGHMQVNKHGVGSGRFKVPAEVAPHGPSNAAAVCVRELPDASNRDVNHDPTQGSLHVNQAPISII
jgi:hypothetical protein